MVVNSEQDGPLVGSIDFWVDTIANFIMISKWTALDF